MGKRFGCLLLEFVLAIVTLGVGYLIWALIVYARGQTPGKQLLGMRVVHVASAHKASWWRMAGREWIGKNVVGLAAGVTLIGLVLYLWPLWDDRNQELWDKMFDTIVVDDREGRFT